MGKSISVPTLPDTDHADRYLALNSLWLKMYGRTGQEAAIGQQWFVSGALGQDLKTVLQCSPLIAGAASVKQGAAN